VVCLSRAVARRFAEAWPACAPRLAVLPGAVDAERFRGEPFLEAGRAVRGRLGLADAFVGLLVARHPRLKGVATAVEALALPPARDLVPPPSLLVVGGAIPRDVLRRARALGVADRLRAPGPAGDVRPWYAAADVLVHATWHDPCSLACLEALAMGLPVVTTWADGVAELLGEEGRGGRVLAPGDAPALSAALADLHAPATRARLAAEAREVARSRPLRAHLDAILDLCGAAPA
jgi:UDP-glucose:(heptosyl)LPS alpha-1,3-glucosyltransferase